MKIWRDEFMLLAIQILLGVLFAGTGIGLVVDLGKNRMDELKGSTGKQWVLIQHLLQCIIAAVFDGGFLNANCDQDLSCIVFLFFLLILYR